MIVKLRPSFLQRFLFSLALMLASGTAFAQFRVAGTVNGAEGPLSGAAVQVQGTTAGAFTDEAGKFTVSAPSGEAVLIVTYFGYERLEVPIQGRSEITITLSESVSTLDEVVVTGYGSQKAKEVTSAIATVKSEDFNRGLVNDPAQLVQGKVAGLSVVRPGSDPNGNFAIRLRGLATLGANTQPLVIIDGVPNASLRTVDPNDIQSIDVLKDGSAAAIYGTQASSGVIIITTKKGVPGSARVDYSGQVTVDLIGKTVPVMSTEEFLSNQNGLFNPTNYNNSTDWMDEVTQSGISTVHNLGIAGGTLATQYRATVNYRGANGMLINSGFQQINGRINLVHKTLGDRLTITTNLSLTNRDANFGMPDALRYAATYNPTAPILAADFYPAGDGLLTKYDGYFQAENFDYFNPVAIIEQNENIGTLRTLIGSLRGDLEIVDGLTLSAVYTLQRENDVFSRYSEKGSYYGGGFNRNGLARRATDNRSNEQFDATVNYVKEFGDISVDVLGGYSFQEFIFDGFGMEGGNFLSDALTYNNFGASRDFPEGLGSVFSYKNSYRIISFFARARVNIGESLFLMASVRNDGSSRFGANFQRASFPAFSVGYDLSQVLGGTFDQLKVRAGYGITGALPGESYQSLLLFEPRGNFFFNGEFVPAFGPSFNANPNLKWETKGELNAGVDFSLAGNKIFGSIDYYNRATRDLIYPVTVAVPPNQASRTIANLEDIVLRNSGVEASIGFKVGDNDLGWEPRILFSTYNTVVDTVVLPEGEESEFVFFSGEGSNRQFVDDFTSPGAPGLNNLPTIRVAAGQPLGQLYGVKFLGVDEAGRYQFEDLDGDGVAGYRADGSIDLDDRQVIGRGLPAFSLGFNNTITIKKVDINFFLRGDFGHDLINSWRVFYEPLGARITRPTNSVVTKYSEEFRVTDPPRFSSLYVENADYVVLDNASIGYSFNSTGRLGKFNGRVFVAGQNLFWITGYTGVDPSPRYGDPGNTDNGALPPVGLGNPLWPGIDRRSTYFNARSFTLGLTLDF